jgi:hypothetical protein
MFNQPLPISSPPYLSTSTKITDILHQCQKPGFLPIAQAQTFDFSLRNPVSQVLLRMVQDLRLFTLLDRRSRRGRMDNFLMWVEKVVAAYFGGIEARLMRLGYSKFWSKVVNFSLTTSPATKSSPVITIERNWVLATLATNGISDDPVVTRGIALSQLVRRSCSKIRP